MSRRILNAALAGLGVAATIGLTGPVGYAQTPALPVERAILTDAPNVPPPITRKGPAKVLVTLDVIETVNEIADGVKYTLWTYGGNVPGKFIRVRQGDLVEFKLHNKSANMVPHNIDLHAVTGPGGGAKVTMVAPGEEATFDWKALHAGIYVYHCATAPVPMHVSNGMFGLILVEPPQGLPRVDHEYYVMQNEFYTHRAVSSENNVPYMGTDKGNLNIPPADLYEFSFDKMLAEAPDYVVWNGRVGSLTGANALKAKVGETVRLFVGNAGLNLVSSFHIIGDHLEKVWREGSLDSPPELNVQNTLIPAGAACMVETNFEVPGDFLLVDHSLGRAFNKGGVGIVSVEGKPRPDVFAFVSKQAVDDNGFAKANQPATSVTTISPAVRQTLSQCATCHDFSSSKKHIVGPPLWGVVGRSPSIQGVRFSKWDRNALMEFLRDPSQVKPNTMMTYRVRDDKARNEVVDALETLH